MTKLAQLRKLASSNLSDIDDEKFMLEILKKCGFPETKITCGIVYLKGQGTIEYPPQSINKMALIFVCIIDKLVDVSTDKIFSFLTR
jgi:hypothetical protein